MHLRSAPHALALVVLAAGASACSSAAPASHGPYPAPHAPLPVIQTFGGPVVSTPKVVPIFFAGDALASQIESFLAELTTSAYWPAVTHEYGIGTLSVAPSVVAPDAAPAAIDDNSVEDWLASFAFPAGVPAPGSDPSALYIVFFPAATTITDVNGASSCNDFFGYHDETLRHAAGTTANFPYAVVARCETAALATIDQVTVTTSHEIVEAVTNPMTKSAPAFIGADNDHLAYNFGLTGPAEVGDMCLSQDRRHANARLVGSFLVQRIWSDAAALAGLDPCVPPEPEPYFAAVPDFTETVPIVSGGVQPTRGVRLAIGESATLTVRLYATGPVPDWSVGADEAPWSSSLAAAPPMRTLDFAWSAQSGNNGDVLQLTVTRIASSPMGGTVFNVFSGIAGTEGDPLSPTPPNWHAVTGFVAE